MIKNFLLIALRSLNRRRFTSIISIIGLALGMASTMLIFLYIQFVLSFDNFHTKEDRIFQVLSRQTTLDGRKITNSRIGISYAREIKRLAGEYVEETVRFFPTQGVVAFDSFSSMEKEGLYFVDSSLFSVYDFTLEKGDPSQVFQDDYTLVISKEMKERYFGDLDPIGRIVSYKIKDTQIWMELKVTGVLNSVPPNSHLKLDFLISMNTFNRIREEYKDSEPELESLFNLRARTYILLKEAGDWRAVAGMVHSPAMLTHDTAFEPTSIDRHFVLEPLKRVFLYSGWGGNRLYGSQVNFLWLLAFAGILLIFISSINVMNFYIARSTYRIKEMGIRKIVGAGSFYLKIQFLAESFIFCVIAAVLSLSLVEIVLPYFNKMIGWNLVKDFSHNPYYYMFLGGLTLILSLLSGGYPAYFLSSIKPGYAFQGSSLRPATRLRTILLILQFMASIFLFLCSTQTTDMMNHFLKMDLGFSREDVIVINSLLPFITPVADVPVLEKDEDVIPKVYSIFKDQLKDLPGVRSVAASNSIPWDEFYISYTASVKEPRTQKEVFAILVDTSYLKSYDIPVIEGQGFPDIPVDELKQKIIINESLKNLLGWKEAVGKSMNFERVFNNHGLNDAKIIGVARDYHFNYSFSKVEPLVILPYAEVYADKWRAISIRLTGVNNDRTIKDIKSLWNSFLPDEPFDFYFMSEHIERKFRTDIKNIDQIIRLATIICVFIACIGLLGMADFETKRRYREIAIRKAMGATPVQVLNQILSEFLQLIMISNVAAWPIAFLGMRFFISLFKLSYNQTLSLENVIITFLLSTVLTLVVVFVQTIKAALSNPVDTLRYE